MRVGGIDHVGLGPDFTKELAADLTPTARVMEGCDMAESVRI